MISLKPVKLSNDQNVPTLKNLSLIDGSIDMNKAMKLSDIRQKYLKASLSRLILSFYKTQKL